MKDKVVALIDMGSNSIRLGIYQIDSIDNYKEIKKDKVAARLINHLNKDGNISEEGIQLIIKTLKQFRKVIDSFGVSDVFGFATAVMRKAGNQAEILAEIYKETNYSFEILSEYEEAYFGYLGVIDSITITDGITIDIGGGSTEITLFKNRKMEEHHSFPFGTVTLNTKYTSSEEVTNKQLEILHTHLMSEFQSLPWLVDSKYPIIAIGGTARNLGKIYQTAYHTSQHDMKIDQIEFIFRNLSSLTCNERSKIKGLSKKRTDIIIPGIQTFISLMNTVQAPYFLFSKKSIRDGVFKQQFMS